MKRLCFALDLKEDPQLISEYEAHHRAVWPEILSSIRDSGILDMEIYRIDNRLFMIMQVEDDFSLTQKAKEDEVNPRVQEWERLMWTYQQALPGAKPGEKWMPMKCIFKL